jgi:Amidohydrolase family
MVQAGLTPLEALQTATINPVKFLGLAKTIGTVEKGKIADLVLLDANPLENIANTKRHAEYLPLSRPGWRLRYPRRPWQVRGNLPFHISLMAWVRISICCLAYCENSSRLAQH